MQEASQGMGTGTGFGGDWVFVLAQAGQPEAGPGPALDQAPGVPGASSDPGTIGQGGGANAPAPGPQSLLGSPILLIGGMLVIIVLTQLLGGRKEKRRRADMLASLKRQDRVQTLGGIIGTIVDMREDEVVLRVDEGTNTRIRFAKSAIQAVLRESTVKDAPQVESKPTEKLAV